MSTGFMILSVINGVVLTYFLLINAVYIVTSAKALQVVWAYRQRLRALNLLDPSRALAAPPISGSGTSNSSPSTRTV